MHRRFHVVEGFYFWSPHGRWDVVHPALDQAGFLPLYMYTGRVYTAKPHVAWTYGELFCCHCDSHVTNLGFGEVSGNLQSRDMILWFYACMTQLNFKCLENNFVSVVKHRHLGKLNVFIIVKLFYVLRSVVLSQFSVFYKLVFNFLFRNCSQFLDKVYLMLYNSIQTDTCIIN